MCIVQVTSHDVQALQGHWTLSVFEVNPTSIIKEMEKIGNQISIEAVMVPESDIKAIQQTPTQYTQVKDKSDIATVVADITATREQTPLTKTALYN